MCLNKELITNYLQGSTGLQPFLYWRCCILSVGLTLPVLPISTFLCWLVENHLKMAVDSQCPSGMCLTSALPCSCSCLSGEPASQPGQQGAVAPLTSFRSCLNAQICRHEPSKTLMDTCLNSRKGQWASGHCRVVHRCLMAHPCCGQLETLVSLF